MSDDQLNDKARQSSFAARLLRSGIWSTVGRLGAMALFIINYRLACDVLPAEEVSRYVVAIGVVSLLSLISGLGLPQVVLRRVSHNVVGGGRVPPAAVVTESLIYITAATLITIAVMIGLLSWDPLIFGKPLRPLQWTIAGWIIVRTGGALVSEIFRGMQRFGIAAMGGGQQGGLIANALLTAILYFAGDRFADAAELIAVQVVIAAIFLIFASVVCAFNLIQFSVPQPEPPDATPPRSMLAEGGKVLVSQLSVMGVVEYETILVGRSCSDVEIVAWGAIRRLITLVSAPLALINAAIPSFIAELYGRGELQKMERLLRLTSTLATPPALIAMVATWGFGERIMTIFREDLGFAAGQLVCLCAANVVFVAAGSAGLTLRMTDHQGWTTTTSIVLSVLYVFAAPAIVEEYQLWGAAVLAAGLIVLRNIISTLLARYVVGVWCIPTWRVGDVKELSRMRRRRKG